MPNFKFKKIQTWIIEENHFQKEKNQKGIF